jgi:hypothetical protein
MTRAQGQQIIQIGQHTVSIFTIIVSPCATYQHTCLVSSDQVVLYQVGMTSLQQKPDIQTVAIMNQVLLSVQLISSTITFSRQFCSKGILGEVVYQWPLPAAFWTGCWSWSGSSLLLFSLIFR